MIRELNAEELLGLIWELDDEIDEPIVIRAVGGFALAWRGVRTEGLTADIDSITDDYSPSVSDAIARIGNKHGLDQWWLNNDAAADDASFLIESMGLKWETVDIGFKNITLCVADLDSLLKLKLSAVEDSMLSGRTRDLDDAIHVLKALEFDKSLFKKKYAYLREDMPRAFELISKAAW